jgi:NTP pyrophosphatase (non-canonical NTP hydrolase)
MTINELCKECHTNAEAKGFWEDIKEIYLEGYAERHFNNAVATRLALIHSEVSEALEAIRNGDRENFKEELADIVIRVFDLCGGLGIDLECEIEKKMEKNRNRPFKHGKEF